MFALTVIGIIVLIIAIIIYLEYQNEKAYQEERKKRTQERKKTKPPYNPKEKVQKPLQRKKEKTYDLPQCKYPKFNYERLIGMGLSEEEAIEFAKELIPQIKTQIPLIKEAMEKEDFHCMERLTHSIKGSSTTVGTGGISDLLVEYNTYLKTGKELPIAEAYFEHLNRYAEDLEKEFA